MAPKQFQLLVVFVLVALTLQYLFLGLNIFPLFKEEPTHETKHVSVDFKFIATMLFWMCNYLIVLTKLFFVAMTSAGVLLYDCFATNVKLTTSMKKLPLVALRVVTRGDYPQLIKNNIVKNKKACEQAGMRNYSIEIVTQKSIDGIDNDPKVKQIVVPSTYQTKQGTLFKGRNLQYCLEDGVSSLGDADWIVHFDEDSVLTPDAVRGIANFIGAGKHPIGQGVIVYDVNNITSYATKLAMNSRLALDYGMIRLSSKLFHTCNIMKGSFVACNVKIQKDVSFDGGPFSSVAEFVYFGAIASQKGYTMGWIDGEMHEDGVLSVAQFIAQHSRGCYGGRLAEKCPDIKKRHSIYLFYVSAVYMLVLPFNLLFPCPFYPSLMNCMMALEIAQEISVGHLGLLKMKIESKLLFTLLVVTNFAIGTVYSLSLMSISLVKSLMQKEIAFEITKKVK